MDELLEIIAEVILEIFEELIKNNKIPKYIRYPIIVIICLFYIGILAIIGYITVKLFIQQKNVAGIIMLLVTIILITMLIYFLKKLKTDAIK